MNKKTFLDTFYSNDEELMLRDKIGRTINNSTNRCDLRKNKNNDSTDHYHLAEHTRKNIEFLKNTNETSELNSMYYPKSENQPFFTGNLKAFQSYKLIKSFSSKDGICDRCGAIIVFKHNTLCDECNEEVNNHTLKDKIRSIFGEKRTSDDNINLMFFD